MLEGHGLVAYDIPLGLSDKAPFFSENAPSLVFESFLSDTLGKM